MTKAMKEAGAKADAGLCVIINMKTTKIFTMILGLIRKSFVAFDKVSLYFVKFWFLTCMNSRYRTCQG